MAERSDTLVIVKTNSNLQSEPDVCMDESGDKQNEKAMCPVMICESSTQEIPPNLRRIIENLTRVGGSDTKPCDLLVSILYTLMIEVGFIPLHMSDVFNDGSVSFHKDHLLVCDSLMEAHFEQADAGLYIFDFILQLCPTHICSLICFQLEDGIAVNIQINEESYVGCAKYLYSKYVSQPNSEERSQKYANLAQISDTFKTQLGNVAKDVILRQEGIANTVLQDLPFEVLYRLFVMLPVKDMLNLSRACRRLHQCLDEYDRKIWKHIFLRDFPDASSSDDNPWPSRYKKAYRKEKQPGSSTGFVPDYLM